ncbi:MAG: hypothetical protein VKM98_08235, partial [Cyanobacteriota bacterium]|nr:hypothetical protein [Cyanobacteriota bacterium]
MPQLRGLNSKLAPLALAALMTAWVQGPAARADDDRTPKPAPATTPTTLLQPQPGWPSLQELLKLPGWMALDVDFTAEPMGGVTPALAAAGSAAWIQQLVIGADFSSGFTKPIDTWSEGDHWQLSTELSSFSGNPNLNLELGTAFPLQTAAHPVGLWLTQATVQRNRGNGPLEFKGGLLALNPSFLESPSFDSYIHSALNNTLNLLIPGLPINPFVSPGAEVH